MADEFLAGAMHDTILDKRSIVQKIWNSHVFTAWFEQHAKALDGRRVRNLRAAKHRFESYSKPLGRLSCGCQQCWQQPMTLWSNGRARARH